jgi:hypothetical protein
LVKLGEKKGPQSFNIDQVRPAKLPSISALFHAGDKIPLELYTLTHMNQIDASQGTPPTEYQTVPPHRILITELTHPRDPRNGQFDDAK